MIKIKIKRNCTGAIDIFRITKRGVVDKRGPRLYSNSITEKNFDVEIPTERSCVRIAVMAYDTGMFTSKLVKEEVSDKDVVKVMQDKSREGCVL